MIPQHEADSQSRELPALSSESRVFVAAMPGEEYVMRAVFVGHFGLKFAAIILPEQQLRTI